MKEHGSNFGDFFYHCRVKNFCTISEIFKKTGISVTQISNIEKGKHCPNMFTVVALMEAIGYGVFVAKDDDKNFLIRVENFSELLMELLPDYNMRILAKQTKIPYSTLVYMNMGKGGSMNNVPKLLKAMGYSIFFRQLEQYPEKKMPNSYKRRE